ncbi:MAG: hypothetical protein ACK5W1_12355 [Flavobacteriales bacterium]
MATLHELIHSLDRYACASFREFAGKSKKEALEVKLFDYYLEYPEASAADLMQKLYGTENRPAFKNTQKRLLEKLARFYQLLRSYEQNDVPDPLSDYHVATTLLHKHAWEGAATYFRKAEDAAVATRNYNLLESIYTSQLPHLTDLGVEVAPFIARREANYTRHLSWCRLSTAYSLLSERQHTAALEGRALDRDAALDEAKKMWRPNAEEAGDPAFMEHFVRLIRRIAVSTKSYWHFELFAGRTYRGLRRKGFFRPADVHLQVGMLYMVAHAQYRNAHFDEALESIAEAEALIAGRPVVPVTQIRKLAALRASVYNFTGRVKEAIPLLERELNKRKPHETDRELLNIQLSLAAYYYNAREYKPAVRTLNTFPHDNNELTRLMGVEWRFKKELFELISFYDRGHYDEAESHLKRMRVYYVQFFRDDQYARAEVYLNHVAMMIKDPNIVSADAFRQQIKDAQLERQRDHEDIQAIPFHCWISSKIFNSDYYEVLLKAIKWKRGEMV